MATKEPIEYGSNERSLQTQATLAQASSASQAVRTMPARISIKHIQVSRDRIICDLETRPGPIGRSDASFARVLEERFPNLSKHACVNAKGERFGAVIADTSFAHVFEHLVIELESRADPQGLFTGTTEARDREGRRHRVELSYRDDLATLAAIKEAHEILNGID